MQQVIYAAIEADRSKRIDSLAGLRGIPLLLMVAYVIIVLLHLMLLSPYFHAGIGTYFVEIGAKTVGSFIGDEALYRLYAEALLHLSYPAHPLYPPAYPAALALAELFSPNDAVKAMIVLNIVLASAVMFPVYALARQTSPRDLAFGAAIVAGLMPASFIFAPALMSENLSTTVFACTFWLAVRQRSATVAVSALFGVSLALCFLTKFLFLATAPFLGAAFMVNQWLLMSSPSAASERRQLVTKLVIAAIAACVPVAIWSAFLVASGGAVSQSLGFHIATAGIGATLPSLSFFPPILGLNGLAIIGSVLPLLPAALIAFLYRRQVPTTMYGVLLISMMIFLLLFMAAYAWEALSIFSYPQPIVQRYFMMFVPLFIPATFIGIGHLLEARRRTWLVLTASCLISLALTVLVQVGLYEHTIWPVPSWVTLIWVGGCDVLYGALGFPVIAVVASVAGALLIARFTTSLGARFGWIQASTLRLASIAILTVALAAFNIMTGLAGDRFAWDNPFVAITAAHGRAISSIIGSRSQDPHPAVITVDPAVTKTIEASSGIQFDGPYEWLNILSFWTGRNISMSDAQSRPDQPHYWISIAQTSDGGVDYHVGPDTFQVRKTPPPPIQLLDKGH